jgi:hypothetical protein
MSEISRCRKSDLVTFAATQRAVEDYCFAHNHLAALFDEEGRALSIGHGIKGETLVTGEQPDSATHTGSITCQNIPAAGHRWRAEQ